MSQDWLDPLRSALAAVSVSPRVFFRDDDAGWDNRRLTRLLDLFARCRVPLDLAVIPWGEGVAAPALVDRIRGSAAGIGVHQHGCRHLNHETVNRRSEFGPARGYREQRADIVDGRDRLADVFGTLPDRFFTPPWNRCTRVTAEILREESFAALSRDVTAEPLGVPGLFELPVAVDWLKKRSGTRVPRAVIGQQLADRVKDGEPFGVMLHHAEMHDADLAALGEVLRLMVAEGVELLPMRDVCRASHTADSAAAT